MVKSPLRDDVVQVQAAISKCLASDDMPLYGYPVVPLHGDSNSQWFEARLQPCGNRYPIAADEFLYAAAAQGVGHRIELRAAAQALNWLENTSGVDRLTIAISQFSLLVPGILDRLLSLISRANCAPGVICVSVTSMDDVDYASHLYAVAREVSRLGAMVMLDRLDDEESKARNSAVTACDFFRLGCRQVRPLPKQVAARCAVEWLLQRLSGTQTQVLAVDVSSAGQRKFLSRVGVNFIREKDPADVVSMDLGSSQAAATPVVACGNA